MNEVATISKGRKIRELKNFEPIKDQLRIAFRLTGLKNLPSQTRTENIPSEQDSLLNFISVNYKHLAIEEIGFAFNLAVTHKLDVDVKHYENFSCEYLGRILKAYQEYRQKEIAKPRESKRIESKPIKKTPEEEFETFVEFVVSPYLEWLKNDIWTFSRIDENICYQNLTRIGIEIMSPKDKVKLYNEVLRSTREDPKGLPRDVLAKRECERIAFKKFLQSCKEFEIDLSELIKSKLF